MLFDHIPTFYIKPLLQNTLKQVQQRSIQLLISHHHQRQFFFCLAELIKKMSHIALRRAQISHFIIIIAPLQPMHHAIDFSRMARLYFYGRIGLLFQFFLPIGFLALISLTDEKMTDRTLRVRPLHVPVLEM